MAVDEERLVARIRRTGCQVLHEVRLAGATLIDISDYEDYGPGIHLGVNAFGKTFLPVLRLAVFRDQPLDGLISVLNGRDRYDVALIDGRRRRFTCEVHLADVSFQGKGADWQDRNVRFPELSFWAADWSPLAML